MKNLKKGDLVKIVSKKKLAKAGYSNENGLIDLLKDRYVRVKDIVGSCDDCPDASTCGDYEETIVSFDVKNDDDTKTTLTYGLGISLVKKIPEMKVGDRVLLKSTKKVLKINGYNPIDVTIEMEKDLNDLEVENVATIKEIHCEDSEIGAFGVIFEESAYIYEIDSVRMIFPDIGDFVIVENNSGEEIVAIVADTDEENFSVYVSGEFEDKLVIEFEVGLEDILQVIRKEDL